MTFLIVASNGKSYDSWEDYMEDRGNYGWFDWYGGENPLPPGIEVEVKFRDNGTDRGDSQDYWWGNIDAACDIVAYRVIPRDERPTNKYLRAFPYDTIDIYRVLQVYGVTDPCVQHAVKKLLCAGKRGYKEVEEDVQEAIQSLQRWEEMRREEDESD